MTETNTPASPLDMLRRAAQAAGNAQAAAQAAAEAAAANDPRVAQLATVLREACDGSSAYTAAAVAVRWFDAQPPRVPVVPGARRSDPSTSAQAAELAMPRAGTQAYWLLFAYWRAAVTGADGFTADEAVASADVPTGAWRRVSDLATLGLIEPVTELADDGTEQLVTRPSATGRPSRVLRITDAGRAYLEQTARARGEGLSGVDDGA